MALFTLFRVFTVYLPCLYRVYIAIVKTRLQAGKNIFYTLLLNASGISVNLENHNGSRLMAKMKGPIKLVGTIDDLNMYQMEGSGEFIARKKPGPSREKLKKHPKYAKTRANNSAFGGGSKFSQEIRKTAGNELIALMYSYIAGDLTGLGNNIAEAIPSDLPHGQEPILISKAHQWLTDYDLNERCLFNSVLRAQLPFTIDRENLSAIIHIPDLLPGIQFKMPEPYAFFKLRFTLGLVTDFIWTPFGYTRSVKRDGYRKITMETDWQESNQPFASEDISLTLSHPTPLVNGESLILYAGIEWGTANRLKQITPVDKRGKGCCKIMGLA